MSRKIAFVISDRDAQVLQRAMYRAWSHGRTSDSDSKRLYSLERQLRHARNGGGQMDAAIIEAVRGAKPGSLTIKVDPSDPLPMVEQLNEVNR